MKTKASHFETHTTAHFVKYGDKAEQPVEGIQGTFSSLLL